MNDTIRVVPVEGRSLPLEQAPRRRVDREMDVPNTAYYRRALSRGDIARAPEKSAKREG
jgi:hypothetical protein